MPYLSCEKIRSLDQTAIRKFGIPGIVLMENAAIRFTDAFVDTFGSPTARKIVIVCGSGNNGGDGFAIARHLFNGKANVTILFTKKVKDLGPQNDAAINALAAKKMGIPIIENILKEPRKQKYHISKADSVIDAVFGTGLMRDVEGLYAGLINVINTNPRTAAVDIPSGLNGDTGKPMGTAVKAKLTVTFAAKKKGFKIRGAKAYTGKIVEAKISIPRQLY